MNLEGTPTPFFDVYPFFSILNFRSRRSRNVASSIALTPVKGFAMSLMRGTKGKSLSRDSGKTIGKSILATRCHQYPFLKKNLRIVLRSLKKKT